MKTYNVPIILSIPAESWERARLEAEFFFMLAMDTIEGKGTTLPALYKEESLHPDGEFMLMKFPMEKTE